MSTADLVGLMFTSLIVNFESFNNAVRAIKKAQELKSAGIL